MSAFAFYCDSKNIVLHSDGRTEKNGDIHSTDTPKVHKIDDDVGLLWIGIGVTMAPWVIQNIRSADVKECAMQAGKLIEYGFQTLTDDENSTFDKAVLDTTQRYVAVIVGYNAADTPEIYKFDSKHPDMRYTPTEILYTPEYVGCLTYAEDGTKAPYNRLLKGKYLPLYQDAEYASTLAFKEMVTGYEAEGQPVGGKIFTETLQPSAPARLAAE